MLNKKIYIIIGSSIIPIGIAAFVAGRMFNSGVSPVVQDGPVPGSQEFTFSSTNSVTPAPELPATSPEIVGLYVEMVDNTMTVQIVTNVGGIVGDSSVDVSSAPKVEVIGTNQTTIYRDVTQLDESSADTQQLVEESTLDYLNLPAMISVWGNRSGDRIVARVLLYSNSLADGKP
ncbi:MAG TPA: hypothetical protein VFR47_30140 [Anaerolineales bacterium]|nr:hypothetical protein [Anaerolineales bacterium]